MSELHVTVATTHPGIARTLIVLEGELSSGDLPPPDVLRQVGEHLRALGDAATARAERVVIDT